MRSYTFVEMNSVKEKVLKHQDTNRQVNFEFQKEFEFHQKHPESSHSDSCK